MQIGSPWFPETLSAGQFHSFGLRAGGTLACWGCSSHGQATPTDGTFVQVSAGQMHSCAMRPSGPWTCWGNNDFGQLGYPVSPPLVRRGD